MDEAQSAINEQGVGLKGFLPAIFARLVTQKFGAAVGDKATIKLNGRLAGYGIMSLGAGEAHILNLCIDGAFRRCGLGRTMLDYLLETARDKDISAAFLEVRPSNEDAIRLYEIAGFEKVGIRKSYYQAENGREDAVVLSLRLD